MNYSILAGWTLELVGRVVTGFLGGSTEMGREIIHWKSYDLIRVDCEGTGQGNGSLLLLWYGPGLPHRNCPVDTTRIWMEFCLVCSPAAPAAHSGRLMIISKAATGAGHLLLLLLVTVVQRDVRLPGPQLVVVQPVLAD